MKVSLKDFPTLQGKTEASFELWLKDVQRWKDEFKKELETISSEEIFDKSNTVHVTSKEGTRCLNTLEMISYTNGFRRAIGEVLGKKGGFSRREASQ